MPALPLHEAGQYVAGAYLVFLALVLIYLAIMAAKLSRIENELGELTELALARHERETGVADKRAQEHERDINLSGKRAQEHERDIDLGGERAQERVP